MMEIYELLESIEELSDDDLIVLSDEVTAIRKRRGLFLLKTYEPGYFNAYQKRHRERRKLENGKNDELRNYRKRHHLTQIEFAELIGLRSARICDFESGALKTPEWIMEFIRKEHGNEPL